jgi:hypothetical protein
MRSSAQPWLKSSTSTKPTPLSRGGYICKYPVDKHFIPTDTKVLLTIRHSGCYYFRNGKGGTVRYKFQNRESFYHVFSAHKVYYPTNFLRGNTDITGMSNDICFHFQLTPSQSLLGDVSAKCPCGCKLTQLMPNHVLCYVNGDMPASIVYTYGVPHHLRENGAGTAPGTNDSFFATFIHILNFF